MRQKRHPVENRPNKRHGVKILHLTLSQLQRLGFSAKRKHRLIPSKGIAMARRAPRSRAASRLTATQCPRSFPSLTPGKQGWGCNGQMHHHRRRLVGSHRASVVFVLGPGAARCAHRAAPGLRWAKPIFCAFFEVEGHRLRPAWLSNPDLIIVSPDDGYPYDAY